MNPATTPSPLDGTKSDAYLINFPDAGTEKLPVPKPENPKRHAPPKGFGSFRIPSKKERATYIPQQYTHYDFFSKAKKNKYVDDLKALKEANVIPEGTFIYDANHPLRLLFHLAGTAVFETVKSYSFWLVMTTHLILLICYYKVDFQHTRIDSSNTAATQRSRWPFLRTTTYTGYLATLVSFCLVFQATQSYNRYFKQYEAVVDMRRGALAFHTHIRYLFSDDKFPGAREVRMKLHKYCLALFYCTYGWLPYYQEQGLHIWCFNYMCELGVLTPEEQAEILSIPKGSKPHQWVNKWLTYYLYREYDRGHLTERSLDRLFGATSRIGGNINTLFEHVQMPVPFAFYHLLNLMAVGYLLLLAYTLVSSSYFYSLIPLALTAMVTLGIRELSNALADPFGSDQTDIPILDYAAKWHLEFENLLEYVPPNLREDVETHESTTSHA